MGDCHGVWLQQCQGSPMRGACLNKASGLLPHRGLSHHCDRSTSVVVLRLGHCHYCSRCCQITHTIARVHLLRHVCSDSLVGSNLCEFRWWGQWGVGTALC